MISELYPSDAVVPARSLLQIQPLVARHPTVVPGRSLVRGILSELLVSKQARKHRPLCGPHSARRAARHRTCPFVVDKHGMLSRCRDHVVFPFPGDSWTHCTRRIGHAPCHQLFAECESFCTRLLPLFSYFTLVTSGILRQVVAVVCFLAIVHQSQNAKPRFVASTNNKKVRLVTGERVNKFAPMCSPAHG